jgi:hypothetical protein
LGYSAHSLLYKNNQKDESPIGERGWGGCRGWCGGVEGGGWGIGNDLGTGGRDTGI